MNATTADLLTAFLSRDDLSDDERRTLEVLIHPHSLPPRPAVPPHALALTQTQAATLLGVHRTTIWRLVNDGVLHPVEFAPGVLRYNRAQVEALARGGYREVRELRQKRAA